MAESLSASEAIRAIHIFDTTIWNQIRYLPLELDRVYTSSLAKLKKLHKQIPNNDSFSTELFADNSNTSCDAAFPSSNTNCNPELEKLVKIVETKKMKDKKTLAAFYHL